MNTISVLLTGLVLFLFATATFAQSYDFAAGVRLGTDVGISAKVRVPPIDKNFTLEGIIQSSRDRKEGLFTILGAQHLPLITRRLNLYAGGGLHFGWLEEDPDRTVEAEAPLGISLIGGAEVNFKRINISADFKPAINVRGGEKRLYSQTAFTLRYQLFKRNDIWRSPKEQRQRQRQKKRKARRKSREKSRGGFNWRFWEKN